MMKSSKVTNNTMTNTQDKHNEMVEGALHALGVDPTELNGTKYIKHTSVQKMRNVLTTLISQVEEEELPEKWKGKVICGFAGIGKSTLARKYKNVVDLESTPFEKDWKRYAKVARHMAQNGYTVLLSCHKEIREELHSGYYLAIPGALDRIEYINRYKERGNDVAFVTLLNQNWEKFLERLPHESEYILVKDNLETTLKTNN